MFVQLVRLIGGGMLGVLALGLPPNQPAVAQSAADVAALSGQTIQFCGDGAEWPPYTYFERRDGKTTKNVVGYDVDVLDKILSPLGIRFTVELPPWRRCLVLAKQGKRYQVALSSSFNNERQKNYLMSDNYYATHFHYFFNKSRIDLAKQIITPADLFDRGTVCGLQGYNYEGTGVFKNNQINQSARDLHSVIGRTLSGRCSYFLFRWEIFQGFKLIGEELENFNHISSHPVPEMREDKFYMLISKGHAQSQELLRVINAGIQKLRDSGELTRLLNQYIDATE